MVSKEWLLQQDSYPASLSQWQSDRMSSLHCVTLTVALCQCVTLVELHSELIQCHTRSATCNTPIQKSFSPECDTVVAQNSQTDAWLPHPTNPSPEQMIIMVVYDNDDEHWLGNLTNEFTQVDSESLYCEPTQYDPTTVLEHTLSVCWWRLYGRRIFRQMVNTYGLENL